MGNAGRTKRLTLGFSPCPNDTFIFDAMVHGKIDTEGLEFEVVMADVEALNQMAFAGELDVTKLSYHAFAHLTHSYSLLASGSALGNNCGPLLIARHALPLESVNGAAIAIPGRLTTANFLLSLAFPRATNRREMLFSDIEGAVLSSEVDMGLIIHENRFTYADKGLVKLLDLGEFWETHTKLPIPLGGIAAKKDLPKAMQKKIERVLKKSVKFATIHPNDTLEYVRPHAQEMDESVMLRHIGLYVNQYTADLGENGKKAVGRLLQMAEKHGIIPKVPRDVFV